MGKNWWARKGLILLILCSVLCAGSAMATTLHGTIYDLDLQEVVDCVVEIDTDPAQRYVSKDGSYAFEVPPGDYTIKVTYPGTLENQSYEEPVSITEEGSYVFDIIIFPDIDDRLYIHDLMI